MPESPSENFDGSVKSASPAEVPSVSDPTISMRLLLARTKWKLDEFDGAGPLPSLKVRVPRPSAVMAYVPEKEIGAAVGPEASLKSSKPPLRFPAPSAVKLPAAKNGTDARLPEMEKANCPCKEEVE